MTYAEHAIENAILAIARGKERKEWEKWEKKFNLPLCDATADEVWSMAQHVCFSLFIDETFEELRERVKE